MEEARGLTFCGGDLDRVMYDTGLGREGFLVRIGRDVKEKIYGYFGVKSRQINELRGKAGRMLGRKELNRNS